MAEVMSEGFIRLAKVVRWAGYLISGFFLLVAALAAGVYPDKLDWTVALVLIPVLFFAGAGWILAWVIEGFAKPHEKPPFR
jgi:hypothetical protein